MRKVLSMSTLERAEKVICPLPFSIEADHPRNSDLLIQTIPNCRLRSAIDGTKGVKDAKTGDWKVPLDQSRHLASFPRTPGMRLWVDPAKLSYKIIDPLYGNKGLCDRITKFLQGESGIRTSSSFGGVPTLEGKLDIHRMKTLCREMMNIVESGEAKVVDGVLPDLQDIEEMPGYFLLNPGCRVPNTQPTYEKDWDAWVAGLSRTG